MALKALLTTKAEYDALAEPVRALYAEKDGKWTLAVEGMVTAQELTDVKTRLAEFRDNNKTMFDELGELRPLKTKLKDVKDLDAFLAEHTELKTKLAALKDKGVDKPDDLQTQIQAALAPVMQRLETAEKERKTAQEAATKAQNDSLFRETVTADAQKAGVRPNGLRHVLRVAEVKFEVRDGKEVPKAGVKHPTDPLKDFTTSDFLADLATTDNYLFAESTGGGANNNGSGGPPPGVKQLINPTPEEMGRHEADIISGKVVVVRR